MFYSLYLCLILKSIYYVKFRLHLGILSRQKRWRWKTFAKNGTQIGASSEGYSSKQNAIKNAKMFGY